MPLYLKLVARFKPKNLSNLQYTLNFLSMCQVKNRNETDLLDQYNKASFRTFPSHTFKDTACNCSELYTILLRIQEAKLI